jgi:hypothetical protein
MKPGSKDIKVFLKFEDAELDLLQDNTWQMAESFGLDRRIAKMTGKREVGFFLWDLECLEMVVADLKDENKTDKILVNGLYDKIITAMDFIGEKRNEK